MSSSNYPPPVYPKPNPEYDRLRREWFLNKVRNTRWDEEDEKPRRPCKVKGPPKPPPSYYKPKKKFNYKALNEICVLKYEQEKTRNKNTKQKNKK